jgi:hypothetical protein
VGRSKKLKRDPLKQSVTVYRVVGVTSLEPSKLAPYFRSEGELGVEKLTEREEEYPVLLDGLCVDTKLENARQILMGMRKVAARQGEAEPSRGNYIAQLDLEPGNGFDLEKRKKSDGKCTVWGNPAQLAGCASRIYRLDSDGNLEEVT